MWKLIILEKRSGGTIVSIHLSMFQLSNVGMMLSTFKSRKLNEVGPSISRYIEPGNNFDPFSTH